MDAIANFSMRRKEPAAFLLILELRLVRHQCGDPRLELLADVDNECRPHVVIKRCIDNLEWAVRGQGITSFWLYPFFAQLGLNLQLLQSREKTRFVTKG